MAKPILDGPSIVSSVRQCVSAGMAQHVSMNLEIETRAFANAFNEAINGVRGKVSTALSGKDVL